MENLANMEREELIELIRKLAAENEALKKRLAELERKAARPAAPFSKNQPKKDPKKPGRKPGQGNFTNRPDPEPTAPPTDVPLDEHRCSCGGCIVAGGKERVTITCAPRPEPQVRAFDVAFGKCARCGTKYRGRHPEVAPDQSGATAHRVCPEVYAMAHTLHYGYGMPQRKVARVLKTFFGISLTQSAIAQNALSSSAGDLASVYAGLIDEIRRSTVVYTDDTGWRIGGLTAFLMAFDSDLATVYQIRPQHRHEEVLDVIGENFAGSLSTDRGSSYDANALKDIPQNKCSSHLLKNISKLLESQSPQAQTVGVEIAGVIRDANELWKRFNAGASGREEFDRKGEELDRALEKALDPKRRIRDPGNRTLLKELRWHYKRGNLLRHLKNPDMEPTNNRAERALRPAVIARKVSHCSKNEAGAQATGMFKSVLETAKKKGIDLVQAVQAACTGANPFAPAPETR